MKNCINKVWTDWRSYSPRELVVYRRIDDRAPQVIMLIGNLLVRSQIFIRDGLANGSKKWYEK